MKTENLKTITKEMSMEELADVLNENFENLNEFQHQREMAVFSRLREIEKKFDERFNVIESDLKKILNHLSGRKLLTEED